MATTDARPGFKLPWSAERSESDAPAPDDASSRNHATGTDAVDAAAADPWGFGRQASEPVTTESAVTEEPAASGDAPAADPWGKEATRPTPAPAAPRRKPNKLMADLTRAMQTAAEAARDESLVRLQADAKTVIEEIHARSGNEATDLRRSADEDVAGIREWSKAEIARVREETERRISGRKSDLEREIEAHAARIEQRIERVQARVGQFEAEMATFFEKLLAEDDPTHLAAMAENLPEPPTFDDDDFVANVTALAAVEVDAAVTDVTDVTEGETAEAPAEEVAAVASNEDDGAAEADGTAEASESTENPDAAFAAIQAAAAAAAAAETEAKAQSHDTTTDAADDDSVTHADDPRIAALGLSPEAAAEAEAEAEIDVDGDTAELATFSDDALAARLTGLVPGTDDTVARVETHTTRVVVSGLISVASIAGFKRQLGRLDGVASVGVSSGPDGEFIFAVAHAPELSLAEAVPTLTEFNATVTATEDDAIAVAARDPESDA